MCLIYKNIYPCPIHRACLVADASYQLEKIIVSQESVNNLMQISIIK